MLNVIKVFSIFCVIYYNGKKGFCTRVCMYVYVQDYQH